MVTHVSEDLPVPRAGLGTVDRGKAHGHANAADPATGSHVKNRITDEVAQENVEEIAQDHDHVPVTNKNHVNPPE